MFSRHTLRNAGGFVIGLVAMGASVAAAPCDIYGAAGYPCVAAHGTTRALYNGFSGPLYQIIRASDGGKRNITALANGIANGSAQDDFCSGTTCLIMTIWDQSPNGNHLTQAPPGQQGGGPDVGGKDNLASASGAPATLNGQKVYGVFVSPGTGYRNNKPNGTAMGNASEGIYAVFDGTHYNGVCCFDYGSAETSNNDDGPGTMEAIYFGNRIASNAGGGAGNGPWISADLENGLFSREKIARNTNEPSLTYRFVTAVIKGAADLWAIRGGDATNGTLTTFFSGPRPVNYTMNKSGAIILGIGGDNSRGGQGTFYEGVMTVGYPDNSTENSVQADIVAAKYSATSQVSGPALPLNSSISLRVTTPGLTTSYITHNGSVVSIQAVSASSPTSLKQQASFTVRTGLGFSGCFSFESNNTPGSFLRHITGSNFNVTLVANDKSKAFAEDTTFCPQAGFNGQDNSFQSWNYPTRFFRQFNGSVYAASNGGVHAYDSKTNLLMTRAL